MLATSFSLPDVIGWPLDEALQALKSSAPSASFEVPLRIVSTAPPVRPQRGEVKQTASKSFKPKQARTPTQAGIERVLRCRLVQQDGAPIIEIVSAREIVRAVAVQTSQSTLEPPE